MPVPLTLVHSPLVGPETWPTPVPTLEDLGHRIVVADLTPALTAGAPGTHLRLSEAYKQEAGRARELGRPVAELDGHHLLVLSQPERVIGPLLDLVAQLQA